MMAKPNVSYEVIVETVCGRAYRLRKRYVSESGAKAKAMRLAEHDVNVRSASVNKITRTIYPTMPQVDRVFAWDREPLFEVISA